MSKKLIKSKIKLTIGMLVSNHVQYIRNAMEALKPLLEAIPSELIVVDTKGEETDGSITIVREYTNKIYPFTWCNDFSAARNVCMEHAKGEWFLYVDDDEWFDDVTEFIEFFQNGECEKYQSGFYYTHDYSADGSYSVAIAGRMIRRRENTRFVGRVHETFNEVYGPNKQFSCFTHHYGYAFQDLETAKKHQERNVSILKKELVEVGCTPRLCAQMVQELMHLEHTSDAGLRFATDALNRLQNIGQLEDSCSQWIIASTVRYFARKKDLQGAKTQLAYVEANYELLEITKLALAGTIANVASYTWSVEDMLQYALEYMKWWDWRNEHLEEALIQANLDIPKFYEDRYYYQMIHVGATAANRLELYSEASKLWKRMPWGKEGFDQTPYEEDYNITKQGLEKQGSNQKVLGNAKILQNPLQMNKKKNKSSKLIKSDVKLTIGMLVSNHIKYIRNAMEALKPLLDAVPSELIVVDTKGEETDGSIDIVREYTDKIYPFTWCNDFSAARNVCLEHAKGEWFLYVDDDEWFDDVQEFIDFFNSKECDNYYSGYYYTRDYLSDGTFSMGIAGRIIRRTDQTRFIGRVHETFNEVFAPNKEFSCFTHHYGYDYVDEEARKQKQQRNVTILKQEIEEHGITPQRAAQFVQELLSCDDSVEEGYRYCMEYIPILEQRKELLNSCSQWLLVASVRCFADRNKYLQLVQQAETIQKKYPLTQVAKIVLAATVMFCAAAENDCDVILKYADIYLENYDWRLQNPDEALLQTQLDFPRFYTQETYLRVLHIAAVTGNYSENYDVANKYWKRMPWGKEGVDASRYEEDLNITIRGLQEAKDKQYKEKMETLVPLLEILGEASEQVKLNFSLGNAEVAKGFLIGMQEAAITLGTSLDSLIGEGSTTVKLLEQYCELLWNCNNAQSLEDGIVLAEFICEAIGLIEENFERDTRRKKTILLFPSKAEDWYLFEPYWKEAKQNGDKVYVIPVPYFEKRYDGSFGEEYYESENFPEDISITKYSEYNYKGKLADVIVVNDNYNEKQPFYSVHPFYYIDNLKQYSKEIEVVTKEEKRTGRKEVVFCPYKASMWDSLESVWMAANEDEDCDAYVVPIPYFDKHSDGSFGEMHYEGDLYPNYVPITDYRAYDFEKRKPDMIFIHNPYDDTNFITSIHPYFYSKNLKEFTDKLVYIPYFVLGELDPTIEYTENDKIATFCLQPAVLNAHKVIVQSEDMKKIYVKILTKAFGKETQSRWEEKILGLGSPKVDKVLSTKKEELQIPEEWKKVITKSDGTNKKVILYNTSVIALLEHREKMIIKIKEVFHSFYESREEVVLLWRPHPLIKATIESMQPQLWKEYESLVEEYKKAGWGIYDDTPDLDRALGITDAYYGDKSSLVRLCEEKGIPVMLQKIDKI